MDRHNSVLVRRAMTRVLRSCLLADLVLIQLIKDFGMLVWLTSDLDNGGWADECDGDLSTVLCESGSKHDMSATRGRRSTHGYGRRKITKTEPEVSKDQDCPLPWALWLGVCVCFLAFILYLIIRAVYPKKIPKHAQPVSCL
jgi:hypothetical protein